MPKCFICEQTESTTRELVPFVNTPLDSDTSEILWICRHGHWDTVLLHAFTGNLVYLTGDYEDGEVSQ